MGTVINIRGSHFDYNYSGDPDDAAIACDWIIVGQDIRDAMDKGLVEKPSFANEC